MDYLRWEDGTKRPDLSVEMQSADGRFRTFTGLLDTGADHTSLPLGYAEHLGYVPKELEFIRVGQARGYAPAWRGTRPTKAHVRGIPEIPFEIFPVFIDGSRNVLWGRRDLMAHFRVEFHELEEQFRLTPVVAEVTPVADV